jgi:hypothetical protein
MKLSLTELVVVGLVIVYIAFFTHPPPSHIKDFLGSPVGHALFLGVLVWVTAYKSLVVGVFLGVAYLMTAKSVTEYLDPTEQKPAAKKPEQPKTAAVPEPVVADLIKDIMKKGDKPAHHAKAGKSVTAPPPATQEPKPAAPNNVVEKFASY